MKRSLSYKTRNQLLLAGACLMLLLLWNLRFSETLNLYDENTRLGEQIIASASAPYILSKAEQDDQHSIIIAQNRNSEKSQIVLLEAISSLSGKNNLEIRQVLEPRLDTIDDFILETNQLLLSGGFHELNETLYQIEQKQKLGRIVSCHFKILTDRRTKKADLVAEVFVQNIWKK